MNTKTIKHFNEHRFQVELEELQKKYAPLIMEQRMLLRKVDAMDLLSFEASMNEKTHFVKASLSAEALGLEVEHYRLVELERILDGKLYDEDVSKDGTIKAKKVQEIKEIHTSYYNDTELEALKLINNAIESYNKIPYEYKNKVLINQQMQMVLNPFNRIL